MKDKITKRKAIEGTIHKRVPQRPAASKSEIYISQKSKPNVIVKRIKQLMVNEKFNTIHLHGMGAVTAHTILIAQCTKKALNNEVNIIPTTGTVTLIDDIIPEDMDKDIETQQRNNSVIHIKIVAKVGLEELQRKADILEQHPSRNQQHRLKRNR
ncbi:unnamed protein product [Cunninghamella blakesleeana]